MSDEYLKMRVELSKGDFPELSYEEIERRIKKTDEWVEKTELLILLIIN